MKRNRSIFTTVLVCIIGIVFVCMAFFTYKKANVYSDNGIKTDAVITKIERNYTGSSKDYDVYVEFTVDGVTVLGELDTYVAGMSVGDTVPVIYMKNNPNDFVYGKMNYLMPILLFVFGILAFAIAFGVAVFTAVKKKTLTDLKNTGIAVSAVISDYVVNYNTTIMEKHPATLSCRDSSGNIYSEKLLIGPGENYVVGDNVVVYVSENDLSKYKIDTSSRSMKGDDIYKDE